MYRTVVSATVHPDPINPYMGLFNHRSIRSLCERDAEIDVIAPRPYAPPIGPYSSYNSIPSSHSFGSYTVQYPRFAYILPRRMFKYTVTARSFSQRVPQYIQENLARPDICHAGHIFLDGYGIQKYCRSNETPYTVMGRGKILNNFDQMGYIARKKISQTLEGASQIVCVSESLASIAKTIVPSEKVSVIPNGADPNRFPVDQRDSIRAELGIDSDRTIVLFCGGFTRRKGVHEIVESIPEIDDLKIHPVFIGHYGDLRPSILNALRNSTLDSYDVLWKIPPLALRRWFAIADIVIQPSHAEGRPNTVYEAMASETPVIGTTVSGIPEQIVDGETGILIPPKDSDTLAKAIKQLVEEPSMRKRMGKSGKERLLTQGWTWEEHGRQLSQLHTRLLDEH